jgi:hypothetical protein
MPFGNNRVCSVVPFGNSRVPSGQPLHLYIYFFRSMKNDRSSNHLFIYISLLTIPDHFIMVFLHWQLALYMWPRGVFGASDAPVPPTPSRSMVVSGFIAFF